MGSSVGSDRTNQPQWLIQSPIKKTVRRVIGVLFADILYNHVYIYDGTPAAASDAAIQSETLPNGRIHFTIRDQDRLLCECYCVNGRGFRGRFPWPLHPLEAVFIGLLTDPDMRGRGLASRLITQASAMMVAHGYKRLFAMVWHNNGPSKRAFHKAGWRLVARHLTFRIRGLRRPINLVWPSFSAKRLLIKPRATAGAVAP